MPGELSLEQGRQLVRLARKAAECFASTGKKGEPESEEGIFGKARGVFVTVEQYPSNELRGCIGYPLPMKPLARAVIDNAIHATQEDPRFPPVEEEEFGKLVFEVSVLTVPELVKVKTPDEYLKQIKIGRDGLIASMGYAQGLLLPQVPVEWGWDAKEFLTHLCEKAGLPRDMWRSPSFRLEKFSAQIFCENKPNGAISEKKLVSAR